MREVERILLPSTSAATTLTCCSVHRRFILIIMLEKLIIVNRKNQALTEANACANFDLEILEVVHENMNQPTQVGR